MEKMLDLAFACPACSYVTGAGELWQHPTEEGTLVGCESCGAQLRVTPDGEGVTAELLSEDAWIPSHLRDGQPRSHSEFLVLDRIRSMGLSVAEILDAQQNYLGDLVAITEAMTWRDYFEACKVEGKDGRIHLVKPRWNVVE